MLSLKRRVLVIDDEHTIADTLAVILQQNDFEAYTAYSGGEAIRLSVEVNPDLIISDVMMPEKNGIDLALEIQAKLPQCRILFFSGYSSSASALLKAKAKGNNWEILAKPVHPHDLLAKVKDLVSGNNRREAARFGAEAQDKRRS